MPSIETAEGIVACVEVGAGETVLLLHASASSSGQWRPLWDRLEESHRVVAVDLYGYGGSDPWPGRRPLRLEDEARLAMAALGRRPGPVHLVGHSYGGAVALRLALEMPERLASLTLFEPVAVHLLAEDGAAGRAALDEFRAVAGAMGVAALTGDYWGAMAGFVDYWNGAGAWERICERRRPGLARAVPKVLAEFAAALSAPERLADYRTIAAPTLLLAGERSPAPTRRVAAMLAAALPSARLEILEGVGHMAPLNRAEIVCREILRHLRALPAVAPATASFAPPRLLPAAPAA